MLAFNAARALPERDRSRHALAFDLASLTPGAP
jgi:hypothetical protein